MHVPPGAALRIRYRTVDGNSGLRVVALDDDTPIMELAPAPDGSEVTMEIANMTGGVRLAPDAPGAVMIELIGLED
ncbi:MAG: hypothetical protein IPK16_27745 [Anaerolineales bacterium]|nr:hypothetical protein [Anaerolineales bacterium]